jgi:hypothetical protein
MKWQYFIHDAKTLKRLDGPYASRKRALLCCDKFNKQGIATIIEKVAA